MKRLSLLTLFTTILLLAPGSANGPAHSTSGMRVADGPDCIPTGPNSCPKPGARERQQLADGPGCIPTTPDACPKPAGRS